MKAFGVETEEKARTSLRLPVGLLEKMQGSMKSNDYGIRERSKWICEAVGTLVAEDCYWELIAEEFMDQGENEVIPITKDANTNKKLSDAEENYTRIYKTKVIDKSMILRAAIILRLVKEGGGLVGF